MGLWRAQAGKQHVAVHPVHARVGRVAQFQVRSGRACGSAAPSRTMYRRGSPQCTHEAAPPCNTAATSVVRGVSIMPFRGASQNLVVGGQQCAERNSHPGSGAWPGAGTGRRFHGNLCSHSPSGYAPPPSASTKGPDSGVAVAHAVFVLLSAAVDLEKDGSGSRERGLQASSMNRPARPDAWWFIFGDATFCTFFWCQTHQVSSVAAHFQPPRAWCSGAHLPGSVPFARQTPIAGARVGPAPCTTPPLRSGCLSTHRAAWSMPAKGGLFNALRRFGRRKSLHARIDAGTNGVDVGPRPHLGITPVHLGRGKTGVYMGG